jgi:hypothetical protein
VWTIISFWLWYDDAEIMSKQFKEIITPIDLLSLPKFKAYIKLMIDWIVSDPFSMKTFPLPQPESWPEVKQKVIKQSRQRYWFERKQLEKLIKIWAEKTFSPVEKAIEKAKKMGSNKELSDEEIRWWSDDKNKDVRWWSRRLSEDNLSSENLLKQSSGKSLLSSDNPLKKSSDKSLSIDDIKIWQRYEGIVKLKYNYWLFVILPWGEVEWLLHKKKIKVPEWIRWKDLYNIGDKIKVKAEKFKEVDWQKKVEWTQLDE